MSDKITNEFLITEINERPMTPEERMELLLHWEIKTLADYKLLGMLFDEEE